MREEFHHISEGKHGARSTKQAIAIGLSKARRAAIRLPAPSPAKASGRVRRQAERDRERGESGNEQVSPQRSHAVLGALKREGHEAASPAAISHQAHRSAQQRSSAKRSTAARKGTTTKGQERLSEAGEKRHAPERADKSVSLVFNILNVLHLRFSRERRICAV